MVASDGSTILEASDEPQKVIIKDDAHLPKVKAAAAVQKVDPSDNTRSKWSLPGVGRGDATDEFADTDSSVDAIKVGGKVVDAGGEMRIALHYYRLD
jgi:hypothetical protein